MAQILSDLAWSTQSSTMSQAIPSENRPNTLADLSVSQMDFDIMIDGKSFAGRESQATGSSGNSCTSWASHQAEGVTLIEPTVCLTSINHPQIEGKFTATPGRLTNLFYGCKD
jgi:hypothetical protein